MTDRSPHLSDTEVHDCLKTTGFCVIPMECQVPSLKGPSPNGFHEMSRNDWWTFRPQWPRFNPRRPPHNLWLSSVRVGVLCTKLKFTDPNTWIKVTRKNRLIFWIPWTNPRWPPQYLLWSSWLYIYPLHSSLSNDKLLLNFTFTWPQCSWEEVYYLPWRQCQCRHWPQYPHLH